jgi:hypothetical protein
MSIFRRWIPGIAVLIALSTFSAARNAAPDRLEGHLSHLSARMVLSDGTTRAVKLEGVGCTVSMCSRVAVNARTEGTRTEGNGVIQKIWLDSISSIQDITSNDALFRLKDGTQRRLSVVTENRILYAAGSAGKIDLSHIQSLTFVPAT